MRMGARPHRLEQPRHEPHGARTGPSRTLPPEGLAELLDAVMAFLLGDPVREGARPGAVRFVSRVF